MKWNEMKRNETKWNEMSLLLSSKQVSREICLENVNFTPLCLLGKCEESKAYIAHNHLVKLYLAVFAPLYCYFCKAWHFDWSATIIVFSKMCSLMMTKAIMKQTLLFGVDSKQVSSSLEEQNNDWWLFGCRQMRVLSGIPNWIPVEFGLSQL